MDAWIRQPKSAQRIALRSRISLAAAEGSSNTDIAEKLKVALPTVGKWRQRFLDDRLEGLVDEPRLGTPRTITDIQVEEIITRTRESKPDNSTHWSTRAMAERIGLSPTAIVRLALCGLQHSHGSSYRQRLPPASPARIREVLGGNRQRHSF